MRSWPSIAFEDIVKGREDEQRKKPRTNYRIDNIDASCIGG